jgi:hypothetical protein
MKSNNFVKKAAKLFGLVLAGSVLYYLAIELLSVLFKSKTGFKVSWGIATYYNYFLFFGVLCVSVLSMLLRNRILYLVFSVLAFLGFVYYWKDTYSVYPNRTVFVLGTALFIYLVTHIIGKKSIKAKV